MNPVQRRGVILLMLAGIGAIAVFAALRSYVADVSRQVGPLVEGLALSVDVGAYEPITADMVQAVTMPARWTPRTLLTSADALVGQVAGTDLPRGTLLQEARTRYWRTASARSWDNRRL